MISHIFYFLCNFIFAFIKKDTVFRFWSENTLLKCTKNQPHSQRTRLVLVYGGR